MARVVHYLNQFFAGRGGEEAADLPPERLEGAVGPGRGLPVPVAATLVCGDDYFAEHEDRALATLVGLLREEDPDLLVCGPAFGSGRYGYACGRLAAVSGVPVVSGMHPDNPGVGVADGRAYIVPTATSVSGMRAALPAMGRLVEALAAGGPIGPPEEAGYLPRGLRRNTVASQPGAVRAVDLVLARLRGEVASEIPEPKDRVVPPAPVEVAATRLALVTEGGLVPADNPDGLPAVRADRWYDYPLPTVLEARTHGCVHGGFPVEKVAEDPNRLVPLDAVRALHDEGALGPVHDRLYTTTGNGMPAATAERLGREIAAELRRAQIGAVILTAT
ncbi:MAG TPA: glycine/betaine/sarcosine/D-proline family reductase selenoprotein B [Acidimicrobiales bacterium]|nr:glycine/betaine/sarcosine/D-proline family reductase selenoprotein B [Acidimicrobiales bacterium]